MNVHKGDPNVSHHVACGNHILTPCRSNPWCRSISSTAHTAPLLAVGVAQVWQSPKQCHFLRLEPFEVIKMVNIYQVMHVPCNIQLMEETSNNHLGYINLVNNRINYNLRIQICPKKGISPIHSYSLRMGLESYISYSIREGSGFLGTSYKHVVNGVKNPYKWPNGYLGIFNPYKWSGTCHVL